MNRILELRKAIDMTQVEFARYIGVHPITISKWERGLFNPNRWLEREIAKLERKINKE